jgi:cation:H+ antiporter
LPGAERRRKMRRRARTAAHGSEVRVTGSQIALFVVGLTLLLGGAELLVRGASRLATAMGVSPLVVGLTVVAYGTGSPELAISLQAAFTDKVQVAYGNVVGSNIFNVLFVLGSSALVAPLVVNSQLVRREVPLMVAVSAVVLLMGLDGAISRIEGLLLLAGGVAYTAWTLRESRREEALAAAPSAARAATPAPRLRLRDTAVDLALVLAGLGMLVIGSRFLLDGAVAFARFLGLSELVIGLTIVAAGTSLPEVATSVLAAARGQRDIAVGNAVGSNLFNLLVALGATSSVAEVTVSDAAASFDTPIMFAVAVACLPIFFTGFRVARWEGGLFLAYYAAYTAYLVLDAQDHDALEGYSTVMAWFALPLTGITLLVVALRQVRERAGRARG